MTSGGSKSDAEQVLGDGRGGADADHWPWADLARSCRERGWIVGLAGSQAESAEVPADVAAWDLDPADDTVTGTLRLLRVTSPVARCPEGRW